MFGVRGGLATERRDAEGGGVEALNYCDMQPPISL